MTDRRGLRGRRPSPRHAPITPSWIALIIRSMATSVRALAADATFKAMSNSTDSFTIAGM